jgi:hypothetical protein
MSFIKYSFIFCLGGAAGAGVTWYIMKNKQDEAIQKAVDEVKDSYSKSKKNVEMKKDISAESESTVNKLAEDASEAIEEYVSNVFDQLNFKEKAEDMPEDQFYISKITLDEFDADEENTPSYLTYYEKDDMVVDSSDYSPMYDPEVFLGSNFREMFKDEEAIHIRNQREGYVYEVVIEKEDTLNDVLGEETDEE